MTIYVSELPKSCKECPFHDTKYGICDISGSRVEYFGCHSLTPLSDYTKQVRNQVVNRIRKQVQDQIIICGAKATEQDVIEANSYNSCICDIIDILDQIQGKTK